MLVAPDDSCACALCGDSLPLTQQYWRSRQKGTYLYQPCKSCYRQKAKQEYHSNHETRQKKHEKQNQRWLNDPVYKEQILARNKRPEGQRNMKEAKYKQKYGLTLDQVETLWLLQKGRCSICKKELPNPARNNVARIVAIDHCHSTGKVRGVLCYKCNLGLGRFDDNPALLQAALDYLQR